MKRGIVKKWGREHGWGYLTSHGGKSYWFHASVIVTDAPLMQRNLLQGQFVEFEPGMSAKGPIATSVRALLPEEITDAA